MDLGAESRRLALFLICVFLGGNVLVYLLRVTGLEVVFVGSTGVVLVSSGQLRGRGGGGALGTWRFVCKQALEVHLFMSRMGRLAKYHNFFNIGLHVCTSRCGDVVVIF